MAKRLAAKLRETLEQTNPGEENPIDLKPLDIDIKTYNKIFSKKNTQNKKAEKKIQKYSQKEFGHHG